MDNGVVILVTIILALTLFAGIITVLTNDTTTFKFSSYSNETNYTTETGSIDDLPDNQNVLSWISFLWNLGDVFPSIPGLAWFIRGLYVVFIVLIVIVLVRGVS